MQLFAVEIHVDFAKDVRPVKPMHAVGQPPILGLRDFQLFRLLKEAGVPYSRLHDVGVYRPHMVDIPNIFRNFDADENDPASYDFYYTDRLQEALLANNVEPWFRLGVSIENHCKESRIRSIVFFIIDLRMILASVNLHKKTSHRRYHCFHFVISFLSEILDID